MSKTYRNNTFLPFKKTTIASAIITVSAFGFHEISSAANIRLIPSSTTGTEGETISLTVFIDVFASETEGNFCDVSGDIVVTSGNSASLNDDFSLSTTSFSANDVNTSFGYGGQSQAITISLLNDNIEDIDEDFELSVNNLDYDCGTFFNDDIELDVPEPNTTIETATISIIDNGEAADEENTEDPTDNNTILLNSNSKQMLNSTSNLSIAGARVHTQNLSNQIRRLRNGLRGTDLSSLRVNIDGQAIAGNDLKKLFGAGAGDEALSSQWGTFLGGSLQIGEEDTQDTNVEFKVHSLFWGADYRLNDNIIVGGAIGYTDSLTEIEQSETELNGYSIAAFSSYYFNEKTYIDGIISYGQGDFSIEREIDDSDGMAKADANSDELSIALNAGHYFRFNQQFVQVFGSINYITVDIDNYQESYQSGSNSGSLLMVDDQTQKSLTSNMGVEYGRTFNTSVAVITPQITLDWERQYEKGTEAISGRIVGSSNTFSFENDTQDQNYFNLGLSLSGVFAGGISAYTSYEVDLERENFDVYDLSLGVRWEL